METTKKPGRPAKPANEKKHVPIRVMLTEDQAARLAAKAQDAGVGVSTYIRDRLLNNQTQNNMKPIKRPGRPSKPANERHGMFVGVKLTKGQAEKLTAKAQSAGVGVSTYIRDRLLNNQTQNNMKPIPSICAIVDNDGLQNQPATTIRMKHNRHNCYATPSTVFQAMQAAKDAGHEFIMLAYPDKSNGVKVTATEFIRISEIESVSGYELERFGLD